MAQAARHVAPQADFTIDQGWDAYTREEHDIWRRLFERQSEILVGRAVQEFVDGIDFLGIAGGGIPDFRPLNKALMARTGWQIVAVNGLVPDDIFFDHLANRRFPATAWIRTEQEMDYLEEPDVFHDVFGHVPLLANPMFADYMAAYGRGGLKALRLGSLEKLARLYWYTVEFGLIQTDAGLRIYGSGIVSSKGESVYALESATPNRLGFDLLRIMRTNYRIDDFQESYFVIDSFEQLFGETLPDFTDYYRQLASMDELTPNDVLDTDTVWPAA
jgi:phenylalanine-4-hydroxylase